MKQADGAVLNIGLADAGMTVKSIHKASKIGQSFASFTVARCVQFQSVCDINTDKSYPVVNSHIIGHVWIESSNTMYHHVQHGLLIDMTSPTHHHFGVCWTSAATCSLLAAIVEGVLEQPKHPSAYATGRLT